MSEIPKKIYGIDLGTTYSAIAYIDEYGKAAIIPNSDNERITPSVVFFESKDCIPVGKIAKGSKETDPDRVVDFVKRQMSNKDWTFSVDDQNYKPEKISSYILDRLAKDANKTAGHEVKDVVITCPAYFGDFERQRTRDAGEIAGLNVIAILDEPVAAALYYGLNADNKGKTIIVYDLGGGTFDVTVVKIGDDGSVEVVCTEGDHQLGGYDWDQRIIEYFVQEFQSQTGSSANPLDDPEVAAELRLLAEEVKQALSVKGSMKKPIKCDGERANVELTREKFDELTSDLLEKTITLTDQVLKQANVKVDTYLLVGGSTRMPQVRDKLCAKYGLTLGKDLIDPGPDVDEMVAKGAAQFGASSVTIKYATELINKYFPDGNADFAKLSKQEQEKVIEEVAEKIGETKENVRKKYVLDGKGFKPIFRTVASKSYGIRARKSETGEMVVFNLIKKQTQLPVSIAEGFSTLSDNATCLELVVFLNNEISDDVHEEKSEKLGETEFPLDGNLPAGSPIEIIFNLDEQGKLILTGIDKTYGKQITADFKSDGVMTEEEKQEAKAQSKDLVH
ncbi:MAG: Hsp70 family protein [Planctomycetaceae bacterium]|jgi:molecular chaperone DnaK (HSP70)|nr:Hsp70 family protein [Planctomycetaceae bacterium]